MRRIIVGLSSVLVAAVIVIVIVVVLISAFFLVPSHNQSGTSEQESTSSLSTEITSTSSANNSSFSMTFAYPGVLIASPDLSAMNYTVSLSGIPGNLTLNAIASEGISAQFSPNNNISLGSTTLIVSASQSAEPGGHKIIVEALGEGFAQNETIAVEVIKYLVVTIGTSFVPSNLTVTAGSNVTWVRLNGPLSTYDDGTHDIAFLTGASDVSPALAQYQSWSYIFTNAGDYNYYCKYHPFMKGEIVVTSS